MNREFVPYEIALELKQLGFDELCFGWYDCYSKMVNYEKAHNSCGWLNGNHCSAPLYSQCFRWFREKHDLAHYIYRNDDELIEYVKSREDENLFKYRCGYSDGTSYPIKGCHTYEEAELECLKKLIEIVK
jgi:hypothetical protein